MTYDNFKQHMIKQANPAAAVAGATVAPAVVMGEKGIEVGADVVGKLGAYILGAAMMTGIGGGYLGAKVTAKTKRDDETVQKGYDNERLKADIGYLGNKLRTEASAKQRQREAKAMRVFG